MFLNNLLAYYTDTHDHCSRSQQTRKQRFYRHFFSFKFSSWNAICLRFNRIYWLPLDSLQKRGKWKKKWLRIVIDSMHWEPWIHVYKHINGWKCAFISNRSNVLLLVEISIWAVCAHARLCVKRLMPLYRRHYSGFNGCYDWPFDEMWFQLKNAFYFWFIFCFKFV